MNFIFHPEAETELNEAIDYYENCEKGLGYDFSIEVYSTIQTIIEYPTAWTLLPNDVRRSLINRFPYGVLYSIELDAIYIIAIMNLHKNPTYWKKRI